MYGSVLRESLDDNLPAAVDGDERCDKLKEVIRPSKNRLEFLFGIISFFLVGAFLLVAFSDQIFSSKSSSLFSSFLSKKSSIASSTNSGSSLWTLKRSGYDPLTYFTSDASEILTYKFLSKFKAIIEPHSSMDLYVEGYDGEDATYYYTFEVCSDEECFTGKLSYEDSSLVYESVNFSCQPFSVLTVIINKKSSEDDTNMGTSSGDAVCLYVRREMRELSEGDLEATMDAMYTLYSVTEEDGIELYGANYHNSTYFVGAHHFNAAWRDADHIHEGMGFMTQHIKISNIFELAMQSVDPSISLPYWDFTIDSADSDYPFGAFPFSEDTFGSLIEPVDAVWGWTYRNDSIIGASIHDGRWQKLKADTNWASWADDVYSGFGYMRAPWNSNPS